VVSLTPTAGTVKVINNSSEPKVLPPGTYTDTTIDLTDFPGLGPLRPSTHSTTAYQVKSACPIHCFSYCCGL
jgi:hypothetical protein